MNVEPHVLFSPASSQPLPCFSTTQRIAVLNEEARLWINTPWCANSEARGPRGGVSCHNLPRVLYVETGALDSSFPRIEGLPDRHARQSRIELFLDSRPEFQRVRTDSIQPGDLLGLRLWHCVDHLGVALDYDLRFIHVLMHKLTTIDRLKDDPTWSRRLVSAWRPIT